MVTGLDKGDKSSIPVLVFFANAFSDPDCIGMPESRHSADMIDIMPDEGVVNPIPVRGKLQMLQGATPEFMVYAAPLEEIVAWSTVDQLVEVGLGLFFATKVIFCLVPR